MKNALFVASIVFLLSFTLQLSAQNNRFDPEGSSTPSVHDPVVAKQGNTYYLFCTGFGISVLSSTDMINW
ncbi:MAG: arabinan endo-1,5-alpha-L-arabinosidase, partial [Bacteroidales bacterium]